ncbi:MAG: MFS transporter [Pseudomonadota bacterium]
MSLAQQTYAAVTGADEDRIERREPRNGAVQVAALALTKTADAILEPKLTLAWLLTALGAPGALVGWLVPVREAGSLLPQLALAQWVERRRTRKLVWAFGSAMQGVAAVGIGLSALMLEGAAAGWAILAWLAALAVARSLCSLSHKDTLARSIPKTRRGAISGIAGSIAAVGGLAFGAALALGVIPLTVEAVSIALMSAGGLWLVAALIFPGLKEAEEPRRADARRDAGGLFAPLREDAMLRRFILARALLTATALAPPFIVMAAAADPDQRLGALGPLLLAAAAAGFASSYVWGRLSDRSSRKTLMAAGALAATVLTAAALAKATTGGLGGALGAALALFAAQIAYEGARQGRKLHLTDMTTDDARARYTALSNSLIGGVLILGGALGLVADAYGSAATLAILAAFAALSAPVSYALAEVQRDQ